MALSLVVQMATSLLDLIGVTLMGFVGALSMAIVQDQPAPPVVARGLAAVGLEHQSETAVLGIVAGAAALVLLTKSVVSPLLMGRVFKFLARRQALLSARLTKELLARPLPFVQQKSSQETAAALLQGVGAATVTVLGQTVVAASEAALLAVLAIALIFVDPWVALGAIAFFGLFGAALQKLLGHRMSQVGAQAAAADIASLRAVQEALGAYREITVANRRSLYVDRIWSLRSDAAQAIARAQVLNLVPKYASEAALVVGAFSLAAILFSTRPVPVAAGTFALILATATRILPSMLRLQSAALFIRASVGPASFTYDLADSLGGTLGPAPEEREAQESIRRTLEPGESNFVPAVELHSVSYTYPGAGRAAIEDFSIAISAGQSVALVGRSGAGKTTLADIILGVFPPLSGRVSVGGVDPSEAVRQWPGGIAYVPQEVMLSDDTLRANVALGLPQSVVDDQLVWDALRRAHLDEYVHRQPDGLDTEVGEHGLRLSGGQRQRLGIARALFTRPRLLVLDEATSALDAETESAITQMLEELDEDVTTVIIAHRLSTICHADLVVYLEEGCAQAAGSFDEVCRRIPALRRQAELMGLRLA